MSVFPEKEVALVRELAKKYKGNLMHPCTQLQVEHSTCNIRYSLCFQLLYSVALWHGVQAALYRAIKAQRACYS